MAPYAGAAVSCLKAGANVESCGTGVVAVVRERRGSAGLGPHTALLVLAGEEGQDVANGTLPAGGVRQR
jgi:hypothetical protein